MYVDPTFIPPEMKRQTIGEKTMKITGYILDEPTEMQVVKSMNERGLGTKIPTAYKIQTDQSKRLYRMYEHTVAVYVNAPQNFDYITVQGTVYKVEFKDGKPHKLTRYRGAFGF